MDKIEGKMNHVVNPMGGFKEKELESLKELNRQVSELEMTMLKLKEERKFVNGRTRRLLKELKTQRRKRKVLAIKAFSTSLVHMGILG